MRVRTTAHAMSEGCLPVIKMAGGKRKLLPYLLPHVPKKITMYAEPFVGGGALFFAIHKRCKNAILIDQNKDLIVFYRALRDDPKELMAAAKRWPINDERTYYFVRGLNPKEMSDVERAARFLFLNKTCFNGLWRVNAKGIFNVPFGHYKDPTVVDEPLLLACSKALQRARIIHSDFTSAERYQPDFIYCDPPYDVVSETSDFTRYAKHDFTWKDQKRLERWARCEGKGMEATQIVLSNADTPRVRKLYGRWDWSIETIMAARAINSNVKKRGKVKELVIT